MRATWTCCFRRCKSGAEPQGLRGFRLPAHPNLKAERRGSRKALKRVAATTLVVTTSRHGSGLEFRRLLSGLKVPLLKRRRCCTALSNRRHQAVIRLRHPTRRDHQSIRLTHRPLRTHLARHRIIHRPRRIHLARHRITLRPRRTRLGRRRRTLRPRRTRLGRHRRTLRPRRTRLGRHRRTLHLRRTRLGRRHHRTHRRRRIRLNPTLNIFIY